MEDISDLLASTRLTVLAPTYNVVGVPVKSLTSVKWKLSRKIGRASCRERVYVLV